MNDIDFDELDRAITSVLKKDNTAQSADKSANEQDSIVSEDAISNFDSQDNLLQQDSQQKTEAKEERPIIDMLPKLVNTPHSQPALSHSDASQSSTARPVPPIVLPARSMPASRTTSSALHTRVMPGGRTHSQAVLPAIPKTQPSYNQSVKNTSPSKSMLDDQVAFMTQKMSRELDLVAQEVMRNPKQTLSTSDNKSSTDQSHAVDVKRRRSRSSAINTQSGRFMDIKSRANVKHSGVGIGAMATNLGVSSVAGSIPTAETLDRTGQTEDDKAVEGEVHTLLATEMDREIPTESDGKDGTVVTEKNGSDSEPQASLNTPIPRYTDDEMVRQLDDMVDDKTMADTKNPSDIEEAIDTVQGQSSKKEDAAKSVASAAVASSVEIADPTDTSQVVDTETHPIFDTESYAQPITPEKKQEPGKIWTILGSMLIVLMVVAVIMVWQLLKA